MTEIKLNNNLVFQYEDQNLTGTLKFLINELYHRNCYFKKNFEIKHDDVIVDIGANMGLFVLWAAPQAKKGKIIAIEPINIINTLEKNLKINNIDNVITLQKAVGLDNEEV